MSYYSLISLMPKTPAFVGLLDTYPGASAAYSLRRLSSTYTGNLIRVRRSSDNTEQDFGFVNNVLDTASLISFVGSGNGFVTTWYDQSGSGNNTTQSNAVQQPQIVSSGAILTQNSKPIVQFDGSNDILFSSSLSGGFNNSSVFSTFRIITQSSEDIPFGYGRAISDTAKVRVLYSSTGQKLGFATWGVDYVSTLNSIDANLYMFSVNQNGNSLILNKNNTQISASLPGTPQTTIIGRYCIGSLEGTLTHLYYTNMNSAEFIFYPSDQSTNRTGIQNNINLFYTLW